MSEKGMWSILPSQVNSTEGDTDFQLDVVQPENSSDQPCESIYPRLGPLNYNEGEQLGLLQSSNHTGLSKSNQTLRS